MPIRQSSPHATEPQVSTWAAPLLIAVLFTACADAGADAAVTSVRRDSAGISIVENSGPSWKVGEEWRVDSMPLFVIAPDAGADAEFQMIIGVTRLDDGRVVALDWREPFVRAFSPDGELVWKAVRSGAGPGEVRQPIFLQRLQGDSLAIEAASPLRSLLLTSDGRHAADLPLLSVKTDRDSDVLKIPSMLLRLRNGSGLGYVGELATSDMTGSGVHTPLFDFHFVTRGDGTRLLGHWPTFSIQRGPEGPLVLLGPNAAAGTTKDGFVYGWPTRDELRFFDGDGNLVSLVRGPAVSRAPTGEEVAAAREAIRGDTPQSRARAESRPTSDSIAIFRRVVGAASGEVWRERFDPVTHSGPGWFTFPEQGALWDVFDAGGTLLGAVRLPPRFSLMDAGDDWIAGVHMDEMDVQTPRVYRLVQQQRAD